METQNQIAQIFKRIDSDALMEMALIVLMAITLILIVQRWLPWAANRLSGKKRLMLLASVPFIRLAIILTAFVMIVPSLIEPSIQNMVALLGTVGLALGFALKDYASSLIAGIVSIGEQNYRNGDWVRIGDVYGEVRHIGMRTVEIVTPDDDRVLIPHNLIWKHPVYNANNGDARLQCVANFYVHPDHDARLVRRKLEDVALTSPYLYFENGITVVLQETPWGTHYRIRAYPVDSAQQFRFISDLTVRGKAALRESGVPLAISPVLPDIR